MFRTAVLPRRGRSARHVHRALRRPGLPHRTDLARRDGAHRGDAGVRAKSSSILPARDGAPGRRVHLQRPLDLQRPDRRRVHHHARVPRRAPHRLLHQQRPPRRHRRAQGLGSERGGLRRGAHHSAAQALRRRRAERAALRDSAAERAIRGKDDRRSARPGGGGLGRQPRARAARGGVRSRFAARPRGRDHAPQRGRDAGGDRRAPRRRVPRRDGDGDRGHRGAADARGHRSDRGERRVTPISPAPRRRCAAP